MKSLIIKGKLNGFLQTLVNEYFLIFTDMSQLGLFKYICSHFKDDVEEYLQKKKKNINQPQIVSICLHILLLKKYAKITLLEKMYD